MTIRIVREPITLDEMRSLAHGQFGDFVKAVMDVQLGVMAIAGEPLALGRGSDHPAADCERRDGTHRPMTEPTYRHQELAAGRWSRLSLAEQLGNVGSEVGRMRRWHGKDERLAAAAFDRALELLDFTLADLRWRGRLREIARARELLCDAALGGHEHGTTLEDLDRYFLEFALAARCHR